MKQTLIRIVPPIATLLCLLWLAGKSVPPRDPAGALEMRAFSRLPVVYQGRVKPYDTLARNSLTIISDRQFFRDDEGERRPAIEWLLDTMSGSPRADEHQVFRIHNHQLLTQLGLERRKGYRYAYHEFEPHLMDLEMQAANASRTDPAERDIYDVKVLEFYQHVTLYHVLSEVHALPGTRPDTPAEVDDALQRLEHIERFSLPHGVPPRSEGEEWKTLLRAVVEGLMTQDIDPAARSMAGMLSAWTADDPVVFNEHLATFEELLDERPLETRPPLAFEVAFNHAAPFYHSSVVYVLTFLLSCLAWLGGGELLRRTSFWLLMLTFVVHTLAIGSRVYISGYPPITNLYGTAVFIGWGCVLLGLLLERIYPLGMGNLLSSTAGFLTLLVAHFLAGDGDTLQMMQAVLDTKFWLATHVIVINFGYAATFLAGGLATLYILRGVFTRSLDAGVDRATGRMIYGVLSFALLLSFVGTVLGGLWADDSWGRFWGWDPKENGALMIVLWNALILHARWAGLVRTRGIAVLAVFGNVITAWSWFGVNQLGVGLHSYGFTESVTFWLLIFVATQLAVMLIGLLPRSWWRSSPRSEKVRSASPAVEDLGNAGAET